jgi:hypothetical protein
MISGEATAYSASFYTKTFGGGDIQDHFFVRDPVLTACRDKFREAQTKST